MDIYELVPIIEEQLVQPLWGSWYLKEKIGSGSFSFVYRAEAQRFNRTDYAAVKIEPITPDRYYTNEAETLRECMQKITAFEKEAEIMYKLKDCPYIVGYEEEFSQKFKKGGSFEGYLFLIRMELLDSVSSLIKQNSMDLSEPNLIKFALNIANGIKAIHDLGYIHRDIKIDNFFRSPKSKLYKLGDFNVSKKSETAYTIAGTLDYIAPEVYKSGMNTSAYTRRVDIYSFGIALYALMNDLYFPFEKEYRSKDVILGKRIGGETFAPPENASPEFARIIMKACAFNPHDRYAVIDDMIEDLNKLAVSQKQSQDNAVKNNNDTFYANSPQPQSSSGTFNADNSQSQNSGGTVYANNIPPQNAEELNKLGDNYYYGNGVPKNHEEAFKWYKLAAEQGQAKAQNILGYFYNNGNGVAKNSEEAFKWYKLSAEQGNANAQYNLGYCYEQGTGAAQNDKEAVKWYKLAAEQGQARALCKLGFFYFMGKGVAQNHEEAVKWYRLAAEQGAAAAQYNLGICYEKGQGVDKNYEEAVKWYKLAAEQGHTNAQNKLKNTIEQNSAGKLTAMGNSYFYGKGLTQNYEEAAKCFRLAAEQGHAAAQFNLGICCYLGKGVAQNYKEAAKWYKLAAEQGHAAAQRELGNLYYYGYIKKGMFTDYKEAVKWYRLAAEQGDAEAQEKLGFCYQSKQGVNKDYNESMKWYKLAAEQGNPKAQIELGDLYYMGIGVEQNKAEAAKWYKKAADQGEEVAKRILIDFKL